jgi:cytochrome c oxidase assembly protein subunit 15
VVVLVACTIVAGGFVAGLRAGLDYNTFPLMDGRLVPESYARLMPFWRNMTENIAAVQFNHRLLATLTVLAALLAAALGWGMPPAHRARLALRALGMLALAQYALGVATLLLVVPADLGTAHQVLAVLVLTAALAALHGLRPAPAHMADAAWKPMS